MLKIVQILALSIVLFASSAASAKDATVHVNRAGNEYAFAVEAAKQWAPATQTPAALKAFKPSAMLASGGDTLAVLFIGKQNGDLLAVAGKVAKMLGEPSDLAVQLVGDVSVAYVPFVTADKVTGVVAVGMLAGNDYSVMVALGDVDAAATTAVKAAKTIAVSAK